MTTTGGGLTHEETNTQLSTGSSFPEFIRDDGSHHPSSSGTHSSVRSGKRRKKNVQLPTSCCRIIGKSRVKPLHRDKLIALCGQIFATGAATETGAPVNIRYCRKRFGMRNRELIDDLIRLKIIEDRPCQKAKKAASAARWRFVEGIRTEAKNKRLAHMAFQTERGKELNGSKSRINAAKFGASRLPRRFHNDLDAFKPGEHFYDSFDAYISEMRESGKSVATMEALRREFVEGRLEVVANAFRMTSTITRLPRQLRRLLTVGGEPSVEMDLPSSHPAFLAAIFAPTEKSPTQERETWSQIVRVIQEGLFYDSLAGCWQRDRWAFVDFAVRRKASTEEREHFLNKSPRSGIKLCFQMLINSPCNFRNTELFSEMKSCLPHFMRRLIKYKAKNTAYLGKQLRTREAHLIADLANSTTQPVATLYDGILTNQKGADEILANAPGISKAHLGFVHCPILKN